MPSGKANGRPSRGNGTIEFVDDKTMEWCWTEKGPMGKMELKGTSRKYLRIQFVGPVLADATGPSSYSGRPSGRPGPNISAALGCSKTNFALIDSSSQRWLRACTIAP